MTKGIEHKSSVGMAIAYYSLLGNVFLPLEPSDYNLIVDDGESLMRIKVISCSYKTKYGVYTACIRTCGGNQPKTSVKKFNPYSCEVVFIVTSDLQMFEIPSNKIEASRQISLEKFAEYKVNFIPR
jgi:hypothetical protein